MVHRYISRILRIQKNYCFMINLQCDLYSWQDKLELYSFSTANGFLCFVGFTSTNLLFTDVKIWTNSKWAMHYEYIHSSKFKAYPCLNHSWIFPEYLFQFSNFWKFSPKWKNHANTHPACNQLICCITLVIKFKNLSNFDFIRLVYSEQYNKWVFLRIKTISRNRRIW